jgi:lipoprotein-anchoring transpeptidase ErfK/SrfK
VYSVATSADCAIPAAEISTAPGKLTARPVTLKASCLLERETWVLPKSVLQLSGRAVNIAGTRFVEFEQGGSGLSTWVPQGSLFLAEQRARRGMTQTKAKWIHFTIGQGTLVVYVGERAVFATLASPGIGGVPSPGADPLSTRTTPVGTYRIQFKHRTDDMSPEQTEDRSYWIADVPYAMYFKQPFAIHVAYWHESFGEPMSGGCINVSPRDGEYLFSFADPQLPEGWYGVAASSAFGAGTTVVIDR